MSGMLGMQVGGSKTEAAGGSRYANVDTQVSARMLRV